MKWGDDVTMTTVTLTDILDFSNAPNIIDYFSLDVEGGEEMVLAGLDFTKYTFRTLTIERPSIRAHKIMTKNGYCFLKLISSWGDALYIHKTLRRFDYYFENECAFSGAAKRNTSWFDSDHKYLLEGPTV